MGQNVNNVEVGKDFSTGQSYVRLHIDITVRDDVARKAAAFLEHGDIDAAFALVKQNTSSTETDVIDSFQAAHSALRETTRRKAS